MFVQSQRAPEVLSKKESRGLCCKDVPGLQVTAGPCAVPGKFLQNNNVLWPGLGMWVCFIFFTNTRMRYFGRHQGSEVTQSDPLALEHLAFHPFPAGVRRLSTQTIHTHSVCYEQLCSCAERTCSKCERHCFKWFTFPSVTSQHGGDHSDLSAAWRTIFIYV